MFVEKDMHSSQLGVSDIVDFFYLLETDGGGCNGFQLGCNSGRGT